MVLEFLVEGFLVAGQLLPYFPQYQSIKAAQTSEGFSFFISLILILANAIRIVFWVGKPFGTVLLLQSVVMIMGQLYMLNVCLRYKLGKNGRSIFSNPVDYFWDWDDFASYVIFIMGIWTTLCIIAYSLMPNEFFFEILGFLALGIEACLGVPQVLRNLKRRSVEGLSVHMILGWMAGDSIKTWYFVLKAEPTQFIMCGIVQVSVDLIIIAQMALFRGKKVQTWV